MTRPILTLLTAALLALAGCGDYPGPEPTASPATTLPECPTTGEIYFAGCANAPASHVCSDARGVQLPQPCVIHDAEGTLTATCVAVCP